MVLVWTYNKGLTNENTPTALQTKEKNRQIQSFTDAEKHIFRYEIFGTIPNPLFRAFLCIENALCEIFERSP